MKHLCEDCCKCVDAPYDNCILTVHMYEVICTESVVFVQIIGHGNVGVLQYIAELTLAMI